MTRDGEGPSIAPGDSEASGAVSAQLAATGNVAEVHVPTVSGDTLRREPRRRFSLPGPRMLAVAACVAAAAIAAAIAVALLGTSQLASHPTTALRHPPALTVPKPGRAATPSKTGSRPGSSTPSSSSSGTPSSPPTVSASLPLVVCPTTFGIPAPAPVPLPASKTVTVLASVAGELGVYSNDQGTMMVLGPRGWVCAAMIAADGSGGVVVHPAGESVPAQWADDWNLAPTSGDVAVVGVEQGACFACTTGQACPLFPAADSAWLKAYGRPCPATKPASEAVDQIAPGVVAFEDPPAVTGDGIPSGGAYGANGVMTYHPGNPNGSYLETCTLPSSAKAECTATLNNFIADYGDE